MAGWPIAVIALCVGHTKQSITFDAYAHVLSSEPDWLFDQLEEQQSGDGSVVSSRYPKEVQNDERPA